MLTLILQMGDSPSNKTNITKITAPVLNSGWGLTPTLDPPTTLYDFSSPLLNLLTRPSYDRFFLSTPYFTIAADIDAFCRIVAVPVAVAELSS